MASIPDNIFIERTRDYGDVLPDTDVVYQLAEINRLLDLHNTPEMKEDLEDKFIDLVDLFFACPTKIDQLIIRKKRELIDILDHFLKRLEVNKRLDFYIRINFFDEIFLFISSSPELSPKAIPFIFEQLKFIRKNDLLFSQVEFLEQKYLELFQFLKEKYSPFNLLEFLKDIDPQIFGELGSSKEGSSKFFVTSLFDLIMQFHEKLPYRLSIELLSCLIASGNESVAKPCELLLNHILSFEDFKLADLSCALPSLINSKISPLFFNCIGASIEKLSYRICIEIVIFLIYNNINEELFIQLLNRIFTHREFRVSSLSNILSLVRKAALSSDPALLSALIKLLKNKISPSSSHKLCVDLANLLYYHYSIQDVEPVKQEAEELFQALFQKIISDKDFCSMDLVCVIQALKDTPLFGILIRALLQNDTFSYEQCLDLANLVYGKCRIEDETLLLSLVGKIAGFNELPPGRSKEKDLEQILSLIENNRNLLIKFWKTPGIIDCLSHNTLSVNLSKMLSSCSFQDVKLLEQEEELLQALFQKIISDKDFSSKDLVCVLPALKGSCLFSKLSTLLQNESFSYEQYFDLAYYLLENQIDDGALFQSLIRKIAGFKGQGLRSKKDADLKRILFLIKDNRDLCIKFGEAPGVIDCFYRETLFECALILLLNTNLTISDRCLTKILKNASAAEKIKLFEILSEGGGNHQLIIKLLPDLIPSLPVSSKDGPSLMNLCPVLYKKIGQLPKSVDIYQSFLEKLLFHQDFSSENFLTLLPCEYFQNQAFFKAFKLALFQKSLGMSKKNLEMLLPSLQFECMKVLASSKTIDNELLGALLTAIEKNSSKLNVEHFIYLFDFFARLLKSESLSDPVFQNFYNLLLKMGPHFVEKCYDSQLVDMADLYSNLTARLDARLIQLISEELRKRVNSKDPGEINTDTKLIVRAIEIFTALQPAYPALGEFNRALAQKCIANIQQFSLSDLLKIAERFSMTNEINKEDLMKAIGAAFSYLITTAKMTPQDLIGTAHAFIRLYDRSHIDFVTKEKLVMAIGDRSIIEIPEFMIEQLVEMASIFHIQGIEHASFMDACAGELVKKYNPKIPHNQKLLHDVAFYYAELFGKFHPGLFQMIEKNMMNVPRDQLPFLAFICAIAEYRGEREDFIFSILEQLWANDRTSGLVSLKPNQCSMAYHAYLYQSFNKTNFHPGFLAWMKDVEGRSKIETPSNSSKFHIDVFTTLRSLYQEAGKNPLPEFKLNCEISCEGYYLDIRLSGSQGEMIAIEVDGPYHLTRKAKDRLREEILINKGGLRKIVHVDFRDWDTLRTSEKKKDFLYQSLLKAGVINLLGIPREKRR